MTEILSLWAGLSPSIGLWKALLLLGSFTLLCLRMAGFSNSTIYIFFPWLASTVWIRLLASLSQTCFLHSRPSTGISGALKTFRQLASWSRYRLTGSVCQGQDVPAVLGVCVWVVPPGRLYVWSREIQGCCGLNAKRLPQACVFEHVSRLMVLLGKAVEPWGGRGSQEVGREDV